MKRLPLVLVHAGGLLAFCLPFLMATASASSPAAARSDDSPWLLAILLPLLIAVALSESAKGRLDARSVALLGVLTAATALLRLPFSLAGANLMFFLPIFCGAVFGSTFGFLLGSLSMAASALLTGGVGPWLPFQMWAMGWIGMGAGSMKPLIDRIHPAAGAGLLALYGGLGAFAFGFVINLYFWPVITAGASEISWAPGIGLSQTIERYRNFYLLTSLPWDSIGAIANALLAVVLGPATIELLRRYRRRFSFQVLGDA